MIVFGHRGAAGEAPENTLAGIRHAIAAGVKKHRSGFALIRGWPAFPTTRSQPEPNRRHQQKYRRPNLA